MRVRSGTLQQNTCHRRRSPSTRHHHTTANQPAIQIWPRRFNCNRVHVLFMFVLFFRTLFFLLCFFYSALVNEIWLPDRLFAGQIFLFSAAYAFPIWVFFVFRCSNSLCTSAQHSNVNSNRDCSSAIGCSIHSTNLNSLFFLFAHEFCVPLRIIEIKYAIYIAHICIGMRARSTTMGRPK